MSAVSRWLLIGAVVLASLWAGVRVYLGTHPKTALAVPAGTASPPSLSDLTPEQLSIPAPKIPERLPSFELDNLAGQKTSSSAFQGKPLVLNFWATWCAPCRQEIPLLQSLSGEWAARGVTLIGIAVDYPDKVQAFAKRLNIGYPLLVGEEPALDLAAKLGMASPVFPFTVFADRDGEVVALYVGELHRPQADLIMGALADLDAHKIALPQARDRIAAGLGKIGRSDAPG